MQEMKLTEFKNKKPTGPDRLRRIARGRERQRHAQARADVRHPQEAGGTGCRDHRRWCGRSVAGRLRLPPLRQRQLPSRSGRHLHLALPDPPLLAEDRRYGRRSDPQSERRRTLFRAAQGQHDQFRRSGKDPAQDPLRQSDAALSDVASPHGDGRTDRQGYLAARHRPRCAAGQRAARTDRRAATYRQDRAAAEHRAFDHGEPSGMLSDRAPDR